MNRYLKKTLLISASALMFLSVGSGINNVQARRYHYRTHRFARRRSVKRHVKRGRNRRARKINRRVNKRKVAQYRAYLKKAHGKYRYYKRLLKRRHTKRLNKKYRNFINYWVAQIDRINSQLHQAQQNTPSQQSTPKLDLTPAKNRSRETGATLVRVSVKTKKSATPKAPYSPTKDLEEEKDQTLTDLNDDRAKNGLPPLTEYTWLDKIAHMRAEQLSIHFGHYNDQGYRLDALDAVDLKYYPNYRAARRHIAENIVSTILNAKFHINQNYDTPYFDRNGDDLANSGNNYFMYDDADSNWGHRKNILNPANVAVGIGTYYDSDNQTFYMTENFSNTPYYDNELTNNNLSNNTPANNPAPNNNNNGTQGTSTSNNSRTSDSHSNGNNGSGIYGSNHQIPGNVQQILNDINNGTFDYSVNNYGSDNNHGSGKNYGSGSNYGSGINYGSGTNYGSGQNYGSGNNYGSGINYSNRDFSGSGIQY